MRYPVAEMVAERMTNLEFKMCPVHMELYGRHVRVLDEEASLADALDVFARRTGRAASEPERRTMLEIIRERADVILINYG